MLKVFKNTKALESLHPKREVAKKVTSRERMLKYKIQLAKKENSKER